MNDQRPEPETDGELLDVVSIWNTIQGEGPFVGMPAVFIRLAGCTLQCPVCDTDYTSGRRMMTVEAVVNEVLNRRGTSKLVVVTGGEPLRQKACISLMHTLPGDAVAQLETNGTVCPTFIPWFVRVVCSPKTTKIHPLIVDAVKNNGDYKYVVEYGWTDMEDGLPTRVLGKECKAARPPAGFPRDRVFVQPCDMHDGTQQALHLGEAIEVCTRFGYRLCLQTQKIVGLL